MQAGSGLVLCVGNGSESICPHSLPVCVVCVPTSVHGRNREAMAEPSGVTAAWQPVLWWEQGTGQS